MPARPYTLRLVSVRPQVDGGLPSRWPVSSGWMAGGVFVVVTALILARLQVRGDALNHVWAEDGRVFLVDAQRHGVASLFYVYAGSLYTVPRVLVIAGEALPIGDYATYTVVVSALVVGALAAFVYLAAARILRSSGWAAVAALGMALAPALAFESLGSIANLGWYFIYAAMWAMLVPPGGPRPYAATIVAGLAALTTPLAVLVAPAAVVRHGRKDALHGWPLRALLVGEVIQAIGLALGSRSGAGPIRRGPSLHAVSVTGGEVFRGILGPAYGPTPVRVVAGVLIAALLVWAWRLAKGQRRLAGIVLTTGLLVYCVTSGISGESYPRYVATAAMFVIAGLACLGPHLERRAAVGSLVLLFSLCLMSFPASDYRLSGPAWSAAIAQHESECRRLGLAATDVPISPSETARLPCS